MNYEIFPKTKYCLQLTHSKTTVQTEYHKYDILSCLTVKPILTCVTILLLMLCSYVLAQFMPTVPYLFTYFACITIWFLMLCLVMCLHNLQRLFHAFSHILHLVPVLCLEYFNSGNTRRQLNVQERF